MADFPSPGRPGDPTGPGGRDEDWQQGGLRGLPRRRPGGAQGVRRLQDVGANLPAPGLSAPREGRVGDGLLWSYNKCQRRLEINVYPSTFLLEIINMLSFYTSEVSEMRTVAVFF